MSYHKWSVFLRLFRSLISFVGILWFSACKSCRRFARFLMKYLTLFSVNGIVFSVWPTCSSLTYRSIVDFVFLSCILRQHRTYQVQAFFTSISWLCLHRQPHGLQIGIVYFFLSNLYDFCLLFMLYCTLKNFFFGRKHLIFNHYG